MPGRKEHEFAGDARSPAAARSFVKVAISDLIHTLLPPSFCDDVVLVVSELVTNAVRAGSATVVVSVEHLADALIITVVDQADGWPEARDAAAHEPNGRGLPLVSAVSSRWGVRLTGPGKSVWAELLVPAS